VSKHTEWEVHSVFIPNATLPSFPIGRSQDSQSFSINYT
jgi:hypothetical protein